MGIFQLTGQDLESTLAPVTQASSGDQSVQLQTTEPVVQNVNTNANQANPAEGEGKTVVLDGPLSQIYTQALNLAYAREDTSTMMAIIEAEKRKQQDNQVPQGTYVYCVSGDSLSQDEVIKATDALSQAVNERGAENVILAMECQTVINSRTQLLDQLGASLKVKVCLSRKNALEAVQTVLKR